MTDLFTTKPKPPLAELLRPKTLDEFVGQRHLLGPGKPLRLAFEAGKLHSFILWGPPGVGKTTLGRLAASATGSRFIAISAVLVGFLSNRVQTRHTLLVMAIAFSMLFFTLHILAMRNEILRRRIAVVEQGGG